MARRKNLIVAPNHLSPKVIFDHPFEERKTIEYLSNIIGSHLVRISPYDFLTAASKILGEKTILELLAKLRTPISDEDLTRGLSLMDGCVRQHMSVAQVIFLLREQVLPLLTNRQRSLQLCKPDDLEKRLGVMQDTFDLTKQEAEVLLFFFLVNNSRICQEYLSNGWKDFRAITTFRQLGHIPLGMKRAEVTAALSRGNLFKARILEKSGNGLDVTRWFEGYLAGMGSTDLNVEFFGRSNEASLVRSDFRLPEDELAIVDLLMKRKEGFNLLFYGDPGTGKTTLAKVLAKAYDRELLTVKIPEGGDHGDMMTGIYVTLRCANEKAIVLVDEADEVLNTADSLFARRSNSKSWINTLLEEHRKRAIWITNRSEQIHPSTMRRFSFSMEFKPFTFKNRLAVLKRELARRNMESLYPDPDLEALCKDYSVDAGAVINAIDVMAARQDADRDTAIKRVRTVLRNHERATTGREPAQNARKRFENYTLDGLNASPRLDGVVDTLAQYVALKANNPGGTGGCLSFLLYGLPGTGKTEFVNYTGHLLGKDVLLRRSSDIHSMWVGQTEKNIAQAFREAREDEFTFKIEFRPLTSEGNLHFYSTFLKPMVPGDTPLTDDESFRIEGISGLTPGDFAVVRNQHLLADPVTITQGRLTESLENEAAHKRTVKPIGFLSC
jgi:transitional endoplasmic reticulum ATPase